MHTQWLPWIRRKWEVVEQSRTLWGSWVQKPFCVPSFLFVENRFQAPWPSLSSNRRVQTVANQGREGIQRQERNSERLVQPWGSILVPKDTYNNIIEHFWGTKTRNRRKMLITWWSISHSREKITVWWPQEPQETTWGQIKRNAGPILYFPGLQNNCRWWQQPWN